MHDGEDEMFVISRSLRKLELKYLGRNELNVF